MEDIKRKCNSMVNFSKFISSKKIVSKIITLGYNQCVRDQLSGISVHNMRNNSFTLLSVKNKPFVSRF